MTACIIPAADPKVLGVIPLFILGDYRYTAGIFAGHTEKDKILAMGRQLRDSKNRCDFEVVAPEEFPSEVISVALSGFPEVRTAGSTENRELVEKYIIPHLWK